MRNKNCAAAAFINYVFARIFDCRQILDPPPLVGFFYGEIISDALHSPRSFINYVITSVVCIYHIQSPIWPLVILLICADTWAPSCGW